MLNALSSVRDFFSGFLIVTLLLSYQFSIGSITQADVKIRISKGKYTLGNIFRNIEKQTGYTFSYSSSYVNVNEEVSVREYNNISLQKFLEEILRPRKIKWTFVGKDISLSPSDTSVTTNYQIASTVDTTITVSGIVVNKDDAPVAGASVIIKGKQIGVVTKNDGSFTIEKVSANALLLISSVSYSAEEIHVNGRSLLGKILLKEFTNELDETIVLAYSTTTRRNSTSNVGTVKAKDIEKQNITNPLLAIQGRVPGVIIEQTTGYANGGISVRIQGQNSLALGSDPLYVIDGVPVASRLPFGLADVLGPSGNNAPDIANQSAGSGNPLSFINSSDIESIDILKDADATSIYGSRAAAGAILITTKRGKAGKTSVDINVQQGGGTVTRRLDMMNTTQYLEMRKEAYTNDGFSVPNNNTIPTNSNVDLTVWDQNRYTNWQKELIGGTAQYTNANVSVSGGTANTQFIMGTGFNRQTTVFPGDMADKKGSMHFSINNTSANQKFKMQMSGNYMIDINNLANTDLTTTALALAPNAPSLYTASGEINWEPLPDGTSTWSNPLAFLNQKLKIKTKNLITNAVLSYQLLPSLTLKSSFGFTNYGTNELKLTPLTIYGPDQRIYAQRSVDQYVNSVESWIIEPQINYNRKLGNGKLDVLIGTSVQQNNTDRLNINASGFATDILMENLSSATSREVYSGKAEYKYNAAFATFNYNFNGKYIVNLSGRRDGSSRFGSENRFHNFGSVGAAWIFSNEDFIRQNISVLSFGKIRMSYGTTGNDQIGDYQYLNTYQDVYGADVPYQGANGLYPGRLSNPYLQWEETRKLSVGVDLGFLDDRILFNTTYYRNRSSNQLVEYALPIITGFTAIGENRNALVQNSGLELAATVQVINNRSFKWSININATRNRNKLVDFPELATSSYATTYVIGQPISIQKVYSYIDVDPVTGLYMVRDKDGNPTTTPSFPFELNSDAIIIADLTPKYYGGFRNTFTYKGFELDVLFQFSKQRAAGNRIGFAGYPGRFNGFGNTGNQPVAILDRWQKSGDIATVQLYSTDSRYGRTYLNAGFSEAQYGDASYLRLKNTSLSWQLPALWQQKVNVKNARLFAQAQNLLTITNYSGLDPETRSSRVLPPLRVVTLGINVTL
jgi:TonB-dependent starch-binding outer membrane protein SusC